MFGKREQIGGIEHNIVPIYESVFQVKINYIRGRLLAANKLLIQRFRIKLKC